MEIETINILVLAYLGDSIYENLVREFLIKQSIANVNDLQKESLKFVSAISQAKILQNLIDNDILNESEIEIIKRGRNHKNSRHPKSCDVLTYKHATAFEALIGYLHLKNNDDRIKEITHYIFKEVWK